ncbi:MAG: hypothetical protein K1X65_22290 [Caldilineales bacterium]|nr:hypothetical protein [Caldilineales bacterium]
MPEIPLPPAYLLILLLAIVYAALFHLWRGRRWSDLAVAVLAALAGMVAGQLLAPWLGIDLLRIGDVYVLVDTLLAWGLMLAANWLKG